MNGQNKVSYSFGEYLLEVKERRLWKESEVVPLTHKAFETLVILVSNKGRVVEKDFLLDKVWADTFVGEGTVAQNILTLRKTLGNLDDGRPFIETVPRVGYRFVGDVKEVVADDEIVILEHKVKTEIKTEQSVSEEQSIAVRPTQATKSLLQNKLFLATATILALAGIGLAVRYAFFAENFASSKFNKIEVKKLTSEGNISRAAISPDGKYLAFAAKRDNGDQSISVKQIENSAMVEIVPPEKQSVIGVTFSPDGTQIYFTTYKNPSLTGLSIGQVFRVPMLGGTPREILADVDSPVSISPDGKQLAFIRFLPNEKQSALMISNIEGKDEKLIASRNMSDSFSSAGLGWSPDGKKIVCAGYVTGEIGRQMELLSVDVATGEPKTLSKENWHWIGQIDWLKDGSGIVFPGWNSRSGNSTDEIWMVTNDGVAKQISGGINGVFSLNLAADSNSMAAIKTDRLTDFWTTSAPDFKQTNKILQNRAEFNLSTPGINWTPDKKIIFGSTFNGNLDIWKMNADGSERQQLTTDKAADYVPVISNDGQIVIFVSNRSGRENLWRMNADGNKQEQLTNEINISSPNISPDNKWVYYISLDEKTSKYFLKKISLETKEVTQITSQQTTLASLSPDGKFIACYFPEIKGDVFNESVMKLSIFSVEDGKFIKQFDAPFNQNRVSPLQWKSNQSISYLTSVNNNTKLWEQQINGDNPNVILDLPHTSVFRFAWSSDGNNLIYEKGETLNDAILINSIK